MSHTKYDLGTSTDTMASAVTVCNDEGKEKGVYSRDMPLYNPLQVSFTGYMDSRMMVFVLNLLGVCRSTWLMFLPHITKVTKLSTIVIPIITVSIVSSPGSFN